MMFWTALREQTLPFFAKAGEPLWRVSVPPGAELTGIGGGTLVDWGGALRWLRTGAPAAEVRRRRRACRRARGRCFAAAIAPARCSIPSTPRSARLHERLKAAFDPAGIFNCGRMYEGI